MHPVTLSQRGFPLLLSTKNSIHCSKEVVTKQTCRAQMISVDHSVYSKCSQ